MPIRSLLLSVWLGHNTQFQYNLVTGEITYGHQCFAILHIKKWTLSHLLSLGCLCVLLWRIGCSGNDTVSFLRLNLSRPCKLLCFFLETSCRVRSPAEPAGEWEVLLRRAEEPQLMAALCETCFCFSASSHFTSWGAFRPGEELPLSGPADP